MTPTIRRRSVLAALAAGAAALAFDPIHRTWISAADARPGTVSVPRFDGTLLVDMQSRADAADDFGHIVHRTPSAVLCPGSREDIERAVRYANGHGLRVTARGGAHSTYGQAQVEAGLVIDMTYLAQIHSISRTEAVVDAGIRWIDLVRATLEHGLAPVALPDLLAGTVGGAIALGGLSGAAHRTGLVADNVIEMEVVTGRGERLACSRTRETRLFDAARGGLGQLGIITQATVPLEVAPEVMRVHTFFYKSAADCFADLRLVATAGRFHSVRAFITPAPGGTWTFAIEAGVAVDRSTARSHEWKRSNDPRLHTALLAKPGATTTSDISYLGWVDRDAWGLERLRDAGLLDVTHPDLSLFLADEAVEDRIERILFELNPDELCDVPIHVVPVVKAQMGSSLAVPETDVFFAVRVRRFARDGDRVAAMLEENRALYDLARERGGKMVPGCALDLADSDWVEHFGESYFSTVARKGEYDPRAILTPGHGVFVQSSARRAFVAKCLSL
jgi:cytokinin dehydrogenase